MRRKKAFWGFIMGTVILAISTAFVFMFGFVLVNLSISLGGAKELIAFSLVSFGFFVVTFVLNAVSIAITTTSQKFYKRKGLVITTIVFNFLCVATYVYSIISSINSSLFYTIFYSCLLLGLTISNVLAIVDLVQNKNALKKESTSNQLD